MALLVIGSTEPRVASEHGYPPRVHQAQHTAEECA